MSGCFVLVVGPSGAGKDTLIRLARENLTNDDRFHFSRRIITRPASEWEDSVMLGESEFTQHLVDNKFALSWSAHGLNYAIPKTAVAAAETGRVVICNVSRAVVETARREFSKVRVVHITAPAEVLERRLSLRARSEDGDLAGRLQRARTAMISPADFTIVNTDTPDTGSRRLTEYLYSCALKLSTCERSHRSLRQPA